jgi:hypothetical protein
LGVNHTILAIVSRGKVALLTTMPPERVIFQFPSAIQDFIRNQQISVKHFHLFKGRNWDFCEKHFHLEPLRAVVEFEEGLFELS